MESAQAKRSFRGLDALRGVAALAVVTLHYRGFLRPAYLGGAYLAVDLFFVISGVVIAYNYDPRLARGLGAGAFMRLRLARLYPLYLAALALSAVPAASALALGLASDRTWLETASGIGFALLVLPDPFSASGVLYPFNLPAWSLFWELAINLVYAFAFRWLSTHVLIAAAAAFGLALVAVAAALGTLDFGYEWRLMLLGLVRVGYSFAVGVLIARAFVGGRLPAAGMPIWLALALVAATLAMGPSIPGGEAIAVLLVFPLLCVLTLRTNLDCPGLWTFLGLISYPIYIVHVPLQKYLMSIASHLLGPSMRGYAPWSGLAMIAALIVIAWLLSFYDAQATRLLKQFVPGGVRPKADALAVDR